MTSDGGIAIPPRNERMAYYPRGRISPQYLTWAERDIASSSFVKRGLIRPLLLLGVFWIIQALSGGEPFHPLGFIVSAVLMIEFLLTIPLQRKWALVKVRDAPLPVPTATGRAPAVRPNPAHKQDDEHPDPMQSFYSQR